MKSFNRLLGFFRSAHGDEGKATGTTRHAVHHDVGLHDGAATGKRILKIVFCGFEGEISDKQLRAHVI